MVLPPELNQIIIDYIGYEHDLDVYIDNIWTEHDLRTFYRKYWLDVERYPHIDRTKFKNIYSHKYVHDSLREVTFGCYFNKPAILPDHISS